MPVLPDTLTRPGGPHSETGLAKLPQEQHDMASRNARLDENP
ncbi:MULTISPECIES: hypothetical protein [unclassified Streptomyces]|nr:hypothetical protein [Streptomyces sp. CB02959]